MHVARRAVDVGELRRLHVDLHVASVVLDDAELREGRWLGVRSVDGDADGRGGQGEGGGVGACEGELDDDLRVGVGVFDLREQVVDALVSFAEGDLGAVQLDLAGFCALHQQVDFDEVVGGVGDVDVERDRDASAVHVERDRRDDRAGEGAFDDADGELGDGRVEAGEGVSGLLPGDEELLAQHGLGRCDAHGGACGVGDEGDGGVCEDEVGVEVERVDDEPLLHGFDRSDGDGVGETADLEVVAVAAVDEQLEAVVGEVEVAGGERAVGASEDGAGVLVVVVDDDVARVAFVLDVAVVVDLEGERAALFEVVGFVRGVELVGVVELRADRVEREAVFGLADAVEDVHVEVVGEGDLDLAARVGVHDADLAVDLEGVVVVVASEGDQVLERQQLDDLRRLLEVDVSERLRDDLRVVVFVQQRDQEVVQVHVGFFVGVDHAVDAERDETAHAHLVEAW